MKRRIDHFFSSACHVRFNPTDTSIFVYLIERIYYEKFVEILGAAAVAVKSGDYPLVKRSKFLKSISALGRFLSSFRVRLYCLLVEGFDTDLR